MTEPKPCFGQKTAAESSVFIAWSDFRGICPANIASVRHYRCLRRAGGCANIYRIMRIQTDPILPPRATAAGDNTPQGVVIRPYAPVDARGCHATFQAAVHRGAARHYDAAARAAWAPPGPMPDDWPAQLGDQMTWVAEDGGRIAGFLTLGRDGHLDLFYVAPDWMGRGLAAPLHDQALATARAMGLTMLSTEASHLARAFLLRHGWVTEARQSVIRHSTAITNFRMSRRIEPAPACASPMSGK